MNKMLRYLPMLLVFVACSASCDDDLNFSLRVWTTQDPAYKLQLVSALIQSMKDKITMRLPAAYYVAELDKLAKNDVSNGHPEALDYPWGISFKTIAVMDCDWDNGQDRLQFAQRFLGPDNFATFKKDYPDKYQKLAQGCPHTGG